MKKPDFKSALIAAVALAAATACASIGFKSGGTTLRLADANGAVESLVADGVERLVPAAEAFTLQLLDGKGEPTRLKSSEFAFELGRDGVPSPSETAAVVGGTTTLPDVSSKLPRLTWRHANGLVVKMKIEAGNGEFRFTPSVEGIPVGMLLEWFDGPQVCIAPDRKLFYPSWDGVEVTKFAHPYRPVCYRERFSPPGGNSLYPGLAQMQFMAA